MQRVLCPKQFLKIAIAQAELRASTVQGGCAGLGLEGCKEGVPVAVAAAFPSKRRGSDLHSDFNEVRFGS